jgi:four helix bundle protein
MMNDECGMMNVAEDKRDLRQRTKGYALGIVELYCSLPKTTLAQTLGKQLLRSGTSVGAQYREAFRARSRAEFISKMESALQELDETSYWLELLNEAHIVVPQNLDKLMQETGELTAIFTSSSKTAKRNAET